MSAAFLALWNDLAPGHDAEYESWHTREHVPERVAAPGFRCGRRYVAPSHPDHRWFTLYDIAGLESLATPEYQDLLANPTPWSAAMRPRLCNLLRAPCAETGAAGAGAGAGLAVLRLAAGSAEAALPMLPRLAEAPRAVRTRLGRRAAGQGAAPAWQRAAAPPPVDDFAAVLLFESLDRPAAAAVFAALADALLPRGADPLRHGGVYDLAFLFPGPQAGERAAHRRRHWPA